MFVFENFIGDRNNTTRTWKCACGRETRRTNQMRIVGGFEVRPVSFIFNF